MSHYQKVLVFFMLLIFLGPLGLIVGFLLLSEGDEE